MHSLFRRPTLTATLLAVVSMSAVNYYHGTPNLIVTAIVFGLVFFALFSAGMVWIDATPKD